MSLRQMFNRSYQEPSIWALPKDQILLLLGLMGTSVRHSLDPGFKMAPVRTPMEMCNRGPFFDELWRQASK